MESHRLIAAIVLVVSLFMLWEQWNKQHITPSAAPAATAPLDATIPQGPQTPLTAASPSASTSPVPSTSTAQDPSASPGTTNEAPISVKTDMFTVGISAQGGDIVSLALNKHLAVDNKSPLTLLESTPARSYLFQSGLLGAAGPLVTHKTPYTLLSPNLTMASEDKQIAIQLRAQTPEGTVVKTYTFTRGSYEIQVRYQLTSAATAAAPVHAYFQLIRDSKTPEGESKMIHAFTGPAVYTEEGKYQKVNFSDIDKNKAEYVKRAQNGWIAMVQHHFVSALLPEGNVTREFYIKPVGNGLYSAGEILPTVAQGNELTASIKLFAGPQEQAQLKQAADGLPLVVDYGWLTVLAAPLFFILQKCHALTGNWGWAIVLLTLLVKLVFYPLASMSYRSMAKLRTVTPQMMRLKEMYGKDRMRLQQEMMALYKKEKVNPFGGCLPILVQIPVFIALYWVLLSAVEMRHAPWLWIKDLSATEPLPFVLPILMGVSMWVQTSMSPTPPDPVQARVMKIMPIAFSVMFFFFPSGLVLYWVVNNLFSIAQQWWITRSMNKGAAKA